MNSPRLLTHSLIVLPATFRHVGRGGAAVAPPFREEASMRILLLFLGWLLLLSLLRLGCGRKDERPGVATLPEDDAAYADKNLTNAAIGHDPDRPTDVDLERRSDTSVPGPINSNSATGIPEPPGF